MRFTIERIRTLVLAAGVLLLAALGAFLWLAKAKNLLSRRDLPQRLGVDIRGEANGYTYVHAFGAHDQYRIHASKEVELKNDRIELHDVQIDLYGEDGTRIDHIAGEEFDFDQKTGIATAQGPVEMLLSRPQPAAATNPKKSPGTNPRPGIDGSRAAAHADAAPGQIDVKTSGVSFDRNSGVVTTAERVNFSMTEGYGSAMGASYNSQTGYLTLENAVELTTHRGADPVEIHAQRAEFDRNAQVCWLHTTAVDYRGGQANAAQARILFRDDGTAQHLDATGGFTLAAATGGRLAAPTAAMDFDEDNQPHRGHMEGGVTMDSVRDGRTVHGTSPTAELEFSAKGQLRHAHLERGVAFDSADSSQDPSGQSLRLNRTWRSPVADVEFRSQQAAGKGQGAASGQVEPESIHGTGGVTVTSESRRGDAAPVPSKIAADEVTGVFGSNSTLRTLTAAGHARLEQTTATGTRQTGSGDRLVASFAPASAAPNREQGSGSKDQKDGDQKSRDQATPAGRNRPPGTPAGNKGTREQAGGGSDATGAAGLQSAELDGNVVIFQQAAAKPGAQPQPPLRATAGKAVYEETGQWLHLTLNPRVVNGGMELAADKVDVSQQSGDAFAHGNVKATWTGEGAPNGPQKTASGGASQGATTLGGKGPAHVIASEAQLNESTGEATFRGHARLWQQANSVSGPVIVLNQHSQTLVARTTDPAEPVRAVLLNAGSAAGGIGVAHAPGQSADTNTANKPSAPSVIRVRGGDLWYSDAEHRAVMRSGVLGAVIAETGTATSSSDTIELRLMPAANAGSDRGGQAQVDRMTATGHVVLTSEGRRGTGQQLVYSSVTGEYVLTGTATRPPKMTDPEQGSVTGEALIFDSRDDSVSIEGGGSETRTETTAPEAREKQGGSEPKSEWKH